MRKTLFTLVAVAAVVVGLSACETTTDKTNHAEEVVAKQDATAKGKPTKTETKAPEKPAKPAKPAYTASQEQAIAAALDYIDTMAFSRAGLIDQLSSEYGSQFPVKDATFAVDHIEVNWNEQATAAALEYLDTMAFSRDGLIDQLESEYGSQFTHEQAVYGVNHAGL
jgi:hypothetical protein